MKSFYLREEKVLLKDFERPGRYLDEKIIGFRWAMIEKNKYIIISQKIFKTQHSDTVIVMNEKEFIKFFTEQVNARAN